eukprot:CAMPEP_0175829130 /NCGR_PEP_ID=MMETSP0107_2-20121207/13174_1 /TAXON_ID=195067 ORGANISM="Goniomonas pacifica, Strain CCMP1869" /NCGR_SAMPLE_ID=MMETSP0107_2 /ASSEMBLY_ACC=CAM_ASM_000203 /LENGTH=138 /DNA_ID=CAMNT_0017141895 /DNA_START=140 /DNA_END=554 /DNA_ORIENTATION=+
MAFSSVGALCALDRYSARHDATDNLLEILGHRRRVASSHAVLQPGDLTASLHARETVAATAADVLQRWACQVRCDGGELPPEMQRGGGFAAVPMGASEQPLPSGACGRRENRGRAGQELVSTPRKQRSVGREGCPLSL